MLLDIKLIAKLLYQALILNVIIFSDIILNLMMMQRNKKKQEWSPQEIKVLEDLYPKYTSKKWKRISQMLKSKGFNRTQIECREKWINFLDPSINKKEWQEWELKRMYQLHSEVGTRWCLVQKQIGRTQNKIKNRFYGTLRNFIRFLLNYFENGRSCLNYQISKLSPKFLNQMYNSQNSFLYLNGQVKNAIYQMGFQIDKRMMIQRVRENRTFYVKLYQFLVNTFQSLNHQPQRSMPLQSQQASSIKNEVWEPSQQRKVSLERHEEEQCAEHQDQVLEQQDLPQTSQSLQNIYLNQSYYYQQSPPVFYYILSYL